ncbi:MAG: DMT family transporter [Candidatus Hydrogenedentes bacterium]|nr:DMT family transporter [Candidatus Hydrogenedentota bacterium]
MEPAASAVDPKSSYKKHALWFLFLLALTNLIWASQGSAIKYLEPFLGPIAITFLPFYVTTVLFVPLLVWRRRTNPLAARPTWSDWKKFAAAGVAGQVLAQLGMTWGITKSLASNGAILNLLIPVITAVLASLILRERVTVLRIVCLVIGLAGVLIMSIQDIRQSSFLEKSYLVGNLLIFGGCTGSAFYNVYCKGLLEKFQEVEILIFSYVTASLASLPILLWQEPDCLTRLATLNTPAWIAFVFLALFMYGVSMLLFFYVLQYLPVTVASASLYLVPVFGVILAMVLVGERLNTYAIAGSAVVLVSTILIMKYDPSA